LFLLSFDKNKQMLASAYGAIEGALFCTQNFLVNHGRNAFDAMAEEPEVYNPKLLQMARPVVIACVRKYHVILYDPLFHRVVHLTRSRGPQCDSLEAYITRKHQRSNRPVPDFDAERLTPAYQSSQFHFFHLYLKFWCIYAVTVDFHTLSRFEPLRLRDHDTAAMFNNQSYNCAIYAVERAKEYGGLTCNAEVYDNHIRHEVYLGMWYHAMKVLTSPTS
jgi:hypothetical protein